MLLVLVLAIALPWRVIRRQRGSIPLLLVLATALGPLLWWSWTRDMTFSVSTYINGELASSYEEGYSTWYRVFVAGELALILAAGGILLDQRLRKRHRPDERPPVAQP